MKVTGVFSLLIAVLSAFNFSAETIYLSKPIIIAELFTSEGCSSCPSAEALLKEMADLTAKENAVVVGLAFHITYWDHLGWKDPYGQLEFTDRQKKYDAFLSTQQYTPQVVVNGEFEFVGGNPIAFRDAIKKAANADYYFSLEASATHSDNQITIDYSVDKKTRSESLNVALVESTIENHVKNGENKGRILKHYNVVRMFHTSDLESAGQIKLDVPPGIDINKCELVLFVQHRRNLRISGASQIALQKE